MSAEAVSPVLVCYDGSEGSRTALDAALQMFSAPLVVASYWQPFGESPKPFSLSLLEVIQDKASVNEREEALAQGVANEGAAIAEAAGAAVEAVAMKVTVPIDSAILGHADELDALAIVLGSRGRSNLGSILLGDVAGDVVQLANRPVFVVPSVSLSARRARERGASADAHAGATSP